MRYGAVGHRLLTDISGYEAPNLEQMARDGMSFTRMYTEPSCTPTRVAAATGRLAVRSGMAGYDQPWSNFVGYRHLKPGFLLYHDQNAFFFIPASVVSANHADCIIKVLEAAEVPRL
jgi:hypothetical protein